MPVVLVSILQSLNCYCYDDGIDQDEHVTEMLSVVLTGMRSLALTSRRSKNETRQKSNIDLNRYHHHRQTLCVVMLCAASERSCLTFSRAREYGTTRIFHIKGPGILIDRQNRNINKSKTPYQQLLFCISLDS